MHLTQALPSWENKQVAGRSLLGHFSYGGMRLGVDNRIAYILCIVISQIYKFNLCFVLMLD